jgi:hypothetical protein
MGVAFLGVVVVLDFLMLILVFGSVGGGVGLSSHGVLISTGCPLFSVPFDLSALFQNFSPLSSDFLGRVLVSATFSVKNCLFLEKRSDIPEPDAFRWDRGGDFGPTPFVCRGGLTEEAAEMNRVCFK